MSDTRERYCPAQRHADDAAGYAALVDQCGRRLADELWNQPTDAALWIADGPPWARDAKGVG